ncbi:hypothetical protein AB1N83_012255 [Pleurotus pulmonarius]
MVVRSFYFAVLNGGDSLVSCRLRWRRHRLCAVFRTFEPGDTARRRRRRSMKSRRIRRDFHVVINCCLITMW